MVPTMWSVVLQSTCYNHGAQVNKMLQSTCYNHEAQVNKMLQSTCYNHGAQVNKMLQCTAWSVVHAWSILQTLNWVAWSNESQLRVCN